MTRSVHPNGLRADFSLAEADDLGAPIGDPFASPDGAIDVLDFDAFDDGDADLTLIDGVDRAQEEDDETVDAGDLFEAETLLDDWEGPEEDDEFESYAGFDGNDLDLDQLVGFDDAF
ncbi:MAG: hypothetical protein ACFB6S_04880 [Geminicoccaceae bacterium]